MCHEAIARWRPGVSDLQDAAVGDDRHRSAPVESKRHRDPGWR